MSLAGIAAGQYDESFRQSARLARSLPFEVMIRPGQEMNGNWYPWSGDPAAYVAAGATRWRYSGRRSGQRQVGMGTQRRILLLPLHSVLPRRRMGRLRRPRRLQLGHCRRGHRPLGKHVRSLRGLLRTDHCAEFQARHPVRGCVGGNGGNKAEWIRTWFLNTIPEQFPRVSAVIWFDYDKEEDWRVNSSPESLQAYKEVAESPLYGGAGSAASEQGAGPAKMLERKSPRTRRTPQTGAGRRRSRSSSPTPFRAGEGETVRATAEEASSPGRQEATGGAALDRPPAATSKAARVSREGRLEGARHLLTLTARFVGEATRPEINDDSRWVYTQQRLDSHTLPRSLPGSPYTVTEQGPMKPSEARRGSLSAGGLAYSPIRVRRGILRSPLAAGSCAARALPSRTALSLLSPWTARTRPTATSVTARPARATRTLISVSTSKPVHVTRMCGQAVPPERVVAVAEVGVASAEEHVDDPLSTRLPIRRNGVMS